MAEMMPGIMDSSSETHREASVMDSVQTALDENPENQRAKIMLEAFQHSMNHPDTEDLRDLRRFIQESGI